MGDRFNFVLPNGEEKNYEININYSFAQKSGHNLTIINNSSKSINVGYAVAGNLMGATLTQNQTYTYGYTSFMCIKCSTSDAKIKCNKDVIVYSTNKKGILKANEELTLDSSYTSLSGFDIDGVTITLVDE